MMVIVLLSLVTEAQRIIFSIFLILGEGLFYIVFTINHSKMCREYFNGMPTHRIKNLANMLRLQL